MKENSREEDMKILEEMIENANIENMDMNDCFGGEHIEAIEHILSDYKKVLKENESLKEYNMEYRRILDLADDRIYRKKYLEERRKEQPTLLYPDDDEIYQRYYELKQENEELKEKSNISKTGSDYWCMKYAELQKENKELKEKYATFVKMSCEIVEQSIPAEKVKDKIEEYKNMLKTCNKAKDIERIKAINERILELEELIEGRKLEEDRL